MKNNPLSQSGTFSQARDGAPAQPSSPKEPACTPMPLPDPLAARQVNPEPGRTHTALDTRQITMRLVANSFFTMAVAGVIGRVLRLVAMVKR